MLCFLALSVILCTTLLQVVPVVTTEPASNNEFGFNCEKDFISDAEITNALIISKMGHPQYPSPDPYNGYHYLGDGLLMYPVVTHSQTEKIKSQVEEYFVVYQNPARVIGVFAITQYNEYVTCSRNAYSSYTPPALDPTRSPLHTNVAITGFQCGLYVIENDLILPKLEIATRLRKLKSDRYAGYAPFPETIPGLEGTNLMWPVAGTDDPNSREESPELKAVHLITDEFGSFVQLSLRLANKKYAKCAVKTMPNTLIPTSRTTNRERLQKGFLCDVFFDDDYLSKCAKIAKEPKPRTATYPKNANLGDKIGDVLLWPIFATKKIDTPAYTSRYFLVMNKNYNTLRVLKFTRNHGYRNCLRLEIKMDQEPENSDFRCGNQIVPNEDLRRMAEIACRQARYHGKNPKIYKGPSFDILGPYLLSQTATKRKRGDSTAYQAVLTHDCILAGAVFSTDKGLKKCPRVDGSTPGSYSEYQITALPRDFMHVRAIYEKVSKP
ncbi:putative guanyl-specific ribonuclease f1 [Golovinomyces cichoracearum]|uniref:Putative guanyl-specific ribonuclease f1 n=1 Tax=Golovinomyces cichoracearum TaxID=62708 RepID=A0A420IZW4_9PEZI|nr:putative guanyl-specific ribonuclease f1 [Golovinomyces cichoracearum]